jgi:hypothetical protein
VVFAFRRCIIITGIDLGAVNGDLSDRLLPVHLDLIPADKRLEEGQMWPRWQEVHPRILGALLDLVADVAGVLPSVHLETKPRMADFARVLAAVDQVLGTNGLARYIHKQGALASESLTGDLFIMAMLENLATTTFQGTSAELLALVPAPERPPKGWPADARHLTQRLRRQAPVMRKAGWTIEDDGGANKTGAIRWTITAPEMARISPLPCLPPPPPTRPADLADHEYGPSQVDDPPVPTLTAPCPACGAPPPCQGSLGGFACEHQIAAGLVL